MKLVRYPGIGVLGVLGMVAVNSCQQVPPVILPRTVHGIVHSVHPADGFVLVRVIEGMPEEGAVMVSSGSGGPSANLRYTGESSGEFYTCDIASGSPAVGDSVKVYRNFSAAGGRQPGTMGEVFGKGKERSQDEGEKGKGKPAPETPKRATEDGKPILI